MKEFADLIQVPKNKKKMDDSQRNNCLDGVVISFEGNFEISNTIYATKLKQSLESIFNAQHNKENIYKQFFQQNKRIKYDNKDNKNKSKQDTVKTSVIGCVLKEDISASLTKQFINSPTKYCLTWLYHLSTILSQQLHFATSSIYNHGPRDTKFMIMNRSPISCLAIAMLFRHKKFLTKDELSLYLKSHQDELFPPCYRPDITIYIKQVCTVCSHNLTQPQIHQFYDI